MTNDQNTVLDEKALLELAHAYDREDAAQRGEPDPWLEPDWSGWREERLACARAARDAYLASLPSQKGQVREAGRTLAIANGAPFRIAYAISLLRISSNNRA